MKDVNPMTQKAQIKYTLATHAIEHLVPSKAAIDLCGKMADGKLNANEAVAALLRQYGLTQECSHD